MMNPWLLWSAVSTTARLSTVLQILIFLPLTLATLSRQAFLLLSLLLCIHSLIHGSLHMFWGSNAWSVLQVPMHPFLLLVTFNIFSSSVNSSIATATELWATFLTLMGPLFIAMEGLSSLLVAQKAGQEAKKLVERGEIFQFGLLIGTSVTYVISAWWIVESYPTAASSPLSSTLLGVALTTFLFLTFIGFWLRRTNIIESSGLALFIAYNVWLCGFDVKAFLDPASSYTPLLSNILPHFQTLFNFLMNTLPKPVLIGLLYRLFILHLASRILPTIGADNWSQEESDAECDSTPTSTFTRILLTYRQTVFVTVYSHLLLLDHSSQIWWRWMNIFFTLVIWSIEILVSSDEDVSTQEPTIYFPRVRRAIVFALIMLELPYLRVSVDPLECKDPARNTLLENCIFQCVEETVITGLGLELEASMIGLTEASPIRIAPVDGADLSGAS